MKKIFVMLLVSILCLSLSSCAELLYAGMGITPEVSDDQLKYQIDEGGTEYTVTGLVNKDATEIEIPATFRDLPVTQIGMSAFENCTALTKVTIPDSIKIISTQAFYGCTGLKSITLPNSVTELYMNAFGHCTGLTSIILPDSVTSIGNWAFSGCTELRTLYIPDSVTEVRDDIAKSSENLTIYCEAPNRPKGWNSDWYNSATVWNVKECYTDAQDIVYGIHPDQTATVGNYLGAATELTIPNQVNGCTVTKIADQAFRNCTTLTSINFPDSVMRIGWYAFDGCSNLLQSENGIFYVNKWAIGRDYNSDSANFTLREDTVGIVDYAFEGCGKTGDLKIPNGVKFIGEGAFYRSSFSNIFIPRSVTFIGAEAFYRCSGRFHFDVSAPLSSWDPDWNRSDNGVVSDDRIVWG